MATRALDAAAWKLLARERPRAAAPVSAALEAWADAADAPAAQRLERLDALDDAGEALREATRRGGIDADERALADWLDDADRAIEVERRKALAERAGEVEQDYDFDNDLRTLTTGVAALLRQVRRGGIVQALLARHGRDLALRLARKPLQAPARELLATYLGSASGVRYLSASCHWEAGAYTFVIAGPAGALARPLRAALLRQTGKRHPVRARSRDDGSSDDAIDDSPDPAFDEPAAGAAPAASAPHDAADAAAEAAWQAQRERLMQRVPSLRRALLARPADAPRLRALIAFAQQKLQRRQTVAARQTIDAIERLLDAGARG